MLLEVSLLTRGCTGDGLEAAIALGIGSSTANDGFPVYLNVSLKPLYLTAAGRLGENGGGCYIGRYNYYTQLILIQKGFQE